MSLFSELTNIYDCDLENIHGDEVYNFINRNKVKIEELDKNITMEIVFKNDNLNKLKTRNYQKSYQISKLKTEIIQKDQRIAELEEENAKLESYNRQLRENYEKCIDTWKQENAKLQEQIRTNRKFYKEQLDKFNYESKEIDLFRERCGYDGWDIKDILLDLYKQTTELDKLKEQFEIAILPKFKQFQKVWYISLTNNICEFEIEEIQWVKCIDGREMITYSNSELGELYEHDLFATEADAQKYLEGMK